MVKSKSIPNDMMEMSNSSYKHIDLQQPKK